MSTDTPPQTSDVDVAALVSRLEEVEEEVAAIRDDTADDRKKMTMIATKGSLDMAYPPLILASTAAAFDWDVTVFFTFWGLDILHEEKSKKLKMTPLGNPSMGMPNLLAAIPGMDSMATRMMERKMTDQGTASIQELLELTLDLGAELQACQMTADLMDYDDDEFYEGVTTGVGAASALAEMGDSDIQLLI